MRALLLIWGCGESPPTASVARAIGPQMMVLVAGLLVFVGSGYLLYRAVRFIGIPSLERHQSANSGARNRLLSAGLLVLLGYGYCAGPGLLFPTPEFRHHTVADLQTSPALRCWEFHTTWGSSPFVPGGWRVRLDTAINNPQLGGTWPRLLFDSVQLAGTPEGRRIRVGTWAPYPGGQRALLHWGDGFTGISMKLDVRRDRMTGWSVNTSDAGGPYWGPHVIARRISCDSTAWIARKL